MTITYTYNQRNQLIDSTIKIGVKTYEYDKIGNLKEVKMNGVVEEIYQYDATNHLVKAVVDDITTEYAYNGLGNRILVKTSKDNTVTSSTEYITDTTTTYQDIIMTKDNIKKATSKFIYGIGQISVDTDGIISYYKLDELGSISQTYDATGM